MRNGELARPAASVLRRTAIWIGAAVVLGAVGSWTAFVPPDRHVAGDSDNLRYGDLRNAPLPTLSVENAVPIAPAGSGTHAEPAPLAAQTARAIFLEVEPAHAEARHANGVVQPADWEAPASPAWLTGTIEEIDD
jgi:hypothetical protein